ncbi:hypothetical protein I4F81_005838 [Pyropia yezoensis]|uniref:Uncharacterized protein n=1 Tax=Pyropia yezoensis TaxID=2788 RepID=A0ACC3BZ94_PYRYE|nr:hypothetical protein I4F81_005838 [Neopyropia yezoensis]
MGNTCYMNAVLQVLYHLRPLREAVEAWEPPPRPSTAAASAGLLWPRDGTVAGGANTAAPLSSSDAYADAHEFLHFLLERVDAALRLLPPRPEGKAPKEGEGVPAAAAVAANCCAQGTGAGDVDAASSSGAGSASPSSAPRPKRARTQTVVDTLFGGAAVTSTRCMSCEAVSAKAETFRDVSLPVRPRRSLNWALSAQTDRETLGGADKYACDECHTYTEAERWWQLATPLPPVFTVHLKLFHGIIVHEGAGAASGHYYAFVSAAAGVASAPWYCYDDSEVSTLAWPVLMRRLFLMESRATPYILVYVRLTELRVRAAAAAATATAIAATPGGELGDATSVLGGWEGGWAAPVVNGGGPWGGGAGGAWNDVGSTEA